MARIRVALKIEIIRWGACIMILTLTFYSLDVKFMLTLRPLKISYPQLSEESIQMIWKIKAICLPTEKQFTSQLQSTVLKAWKSHRLMERVGGEDTLSSNSHHCLGLHILSANPHKEVTFPPILQKTDSQRENNNNMVSRHAFVFLAPKLVPFPVHLCCHL